MNGQCRPEAELQLGQLEPLANERKNEERNHVEEKYQAECYSSFMRLGTDNRTQRSDCRAATDRGAGGNELTRDFVHPQEQTVDQAEAQCADYKQRNTPGVARTQVPDRFKIQPETQQYDCRLQAVLAIQRTFCQRRTIERQRDGTTDKQGDSRITKRYQWRQDQH